jgi:hypothetical protein
MFIMNRPSSTITAATLAGMGTALVWELLVTFTDVSLSAGLIAASTVFVSSAVGYWKKENVLGTSK